MNSKGIIEVTVGCRLRKKRRRIALDGSGWKRTDLGRQRCEGTSDGRRKRANARSRQEASRGEHKGADIRGRHDEGVGPEQARRTLWRESGASGCTRRKKGKAKVGTGDPGGPDAKSGSYSPGSGLCPSREQLSFADVLYLYGQSLSLDILYTPS